MKTIKLGQMFEVDKSQFVLARIGYKRYQLVGITDQFYCENGIVFDELPKIIFSKEDMQQLSVNRFDDLVMIPEYIKMCDFFDKIRFDELQRGQKFRLLDCNTLYQKINNNGDDALNLETYSTVYIQNHCKVKLEV